MQENARSLWSLAPTPLDVVAATSSAATSAVLTNPLEVIKSHQQLRWGRHGPGLVATARTIFAASGASGFGAGIVPYTAYCCAMNGTRFVIFSTVKKARGGRADGPTVSKLGHTLGVSVFAGGVGAVVSNPLNVARIRLQASGAPPEAPHLVDPHRGQGLLRRLGSELRSLAGAARHTPWWFGFHVQLPRLAIASGAQLSTYEMTRSTLHLYFPREPPPPTGGGGRRAVTWREACASICGGAAAVLAMTPVDTMTTRFIALNAGPGSGGRRTGAARAASGVFHLAARLVREEGMLSLWKGATALFIRVGPSSVVNVLLWEWLHAVLGGR